ncbi:4,5-DOPA dioxygenase extradiol [Candidatus Methylospira mobilis]|uniref:4,5-DOPA dioxygenase extradiol n=1 Tax=Candidatus Methylospira mobilis TaxID=1808979 RepID=A0A5Q0BHU9_9GAMM|nr:4,5-DOPA dioxygenase extradiol [Candidatus Methylospira mobilis]QFY43400.1 4,5-DOPA dioxygenase extradiol [Candidatus Methylospira mobilis]WNV03363.1 4,5-DOPA dioxygenase extradiol [Candidatus Methylospira mobilis]
MKIPDATAANQKPDGPAYQMPVLFIGHGSPMNAIEDNEFSRAWSRIAQSFPKPEAILCLSAHWETAGTYVTAMLQPRTIHDFAGFPQALFDLEYPAPGEPALAERIRQTVEGVAIKPDFDWGLDHGAWSILRRMYPQADIPVLQLSLDHSKPAQFHYDLGRALKVLRNQGVLVLGSGNIVHNLGAVIWKDIAHDWAIAFDQQIRKLILAGEHDAIIHYQQLGEAARLSVPAFDHFCPLLPVLGLQDKGEAVTFFCEKVTLGAISMSSVLIGQNKPDQV